MILAIEIYSMLLFYNVILYCAILSYQFVKNPLDTLETLERLDVFVVTFLLLFVLVSLPLNLITFIKLIIIEIKGN